MVSSAAMMARLNSMPGHLEHADGQGHIVEQRATTAARPNCHSNRSQI